MLHQTPLLALLRRLEAQNIWRMSHNVLSSQPFSTSAAVEAAYGEEGWVRRRRPLQVAGCAVAATWFWPWHRRSGVLPLTQQHAGDGWPYAAARAQATCLVRCRLTPAGSARVSACCRACCPRRRRGVVRQPSCQRSGCCEDPGAPDTAVGPHQCVMAALGSSVDTVHDTHLGHMLRCAPPAALLLRPTLAASLPCQRVS